MNIQELTDEELNLAMIWLNPPTTSIIPFGCGYITHNAGDDQAHYLNHLTDWSLTGPLMVEYGIELCPGFYDKNGNPQDWNAECFQSEVDTQVGHTNPLRAICECVLMLRSKK